MRVERIVRPAGGPYVVRQCQCPREKLDPGTIGYEGYREKRASLNGRDPSTCMRQASWIVNGVEMCTSHGGLTVLEALAQ